MIQVQLPKQLWVQYYINGCDYSTMRMDGLNYQEGSRLWLCKCAQLTVFLWKHLPSWVTQHSNTTNRLALLICTAINQMRDGERERERERKDGEDKQDGRDGRERRGEKLHSEREVKMERIWQQWRTRERNEGIGPEIPSLIIVCCDKPLWERHVNSRGCQFD